MDGLNEFFINYGYIGMFVAAFLAGSFVPFSSEVVMGALLIATDMDTFWVVVSGTLGNTAGSMLNFFIGRCAKPDRVARFFHIKLERMEQTQRFVGKYGFYSALFSFLPLIGTAIALSLGMLRANTWLVLLFTAIGKFLRYLVVAYSVTAVF